MTSNKDCRECARVPIREMLTVGESDGHDIRAVEGLLRYPSPNEGPVLQLAMVFFAGISRQKPHESKAE